MKISKNFEQGIYVLLLLGTQKSHSPIKSATMSKILKVSDSSLKKILRKLVIKDLISSNASKDGGFTLKRPVTEITLYDVLQAVEGTEVINYSISHIARAIFPNKEHTIESENLVIEALDRGKLSFASELSKVTLSKLIESEAISDGTIDWTTHIK